MLTVFVRVGTSAAALQDIIDTAADGTRIILEEGVYRFSQTVEIDHNRIALEGQGQVTIIADACLKGEPAIQIGAPLYTEATDPPVKVTADAAEGARSMVVQSGHGLQVGDVIWVEQPNDAALFSKIGDTLWREDKPLRTGLVVITSVNGNAIGLDRGLPFDFDANLTHVEVTHMVAGVTIKNITLQGDFGTSNKADFTNTVGNESGGMMLVVNASIGTVLENVDIIEPGSNGLVIGRSLDAVVTDVSVTGAHNKGEGGNGYAFWLRDITDCSFSDLRAVDTRHAVLFASYTSATGNNVHVAFTNRDINFHGGLDHDNTIVVDVSSRSVDEQPLMGAVSFNNPGTTYGAPTDADANTITYRHVVGTVRADLVTAHSGGSTISTLGGNDTIIGGAGRDIVDAGTGNDMIYASQGDDSVFGGAGTDTFVFEFDRDQAIIRTVGDNTIVTTSLGSATLTEVENIKFSAGTIGLGTALTPVLHGTAGYERTAISGSMIADNDVNAVTMVGTRNISFLGNALANNVIGNSGNNLIFGEAGNDRLFGGSGQDFLNGGSGNDALRAGSGNDTLNGGEGNDTLLGQQGADVFVGSEGTNSVADFNIAQGDTVKFRGFSDADLLLSLNHYLAGAAQSADGFTISSQFINGKAATVILSDFGDSLALENIDASHLYSYLLG